MSFPSTDWSGSTSTSGFGDSGFSSSDFPNFPSSDPFGSGSSSSTSSTYQSYNNGGCALTPAASAFSSILSALIGSVINGLGSGWLVAFATGWIAWLAIFRVIASAIYLLYRSLFDRWGPGKTQQSPGAGQDEASYSMGHQTDVEAHAWSKATNAVRRTLWDSYWPSPAVVRGLDPYPVGKGASRNVIVRVWTDLNQDVTVLGWLSWIYCALYAPITQILWVAANASNHHMAGPKLVKGLTTAVTALPLCIDCRARYADKLKWGRYPFNLVTSLSVLAQAVTGTYLLTSAAAELSKYSAFPAINYMIAIYIFFSMVWMSISFVILPMRDGGRKRAGQAHWVGYFIDFGVGAFAGVFLAAPAMFLYLSAQFDARVSGATGDGPKELMAYLKCETDWWKRAVAVTP